MNKPKHLYLHVPFCYKICAYCDFFRAKSHPQLIEAWLQACIKDLELLSGSYQTIYIGGGTPTSLNQLQLETLLSKLAPLLCSNGEFTIEANPESLTKDKLVVLTNNRVNRISLGIQAFDRKVLKYINRDFDVDTKALINDIYNSGIKHISIDLIYGLPFQDENIFLEDIKLASQLPIDHLSLYSLTIEDNAQFKRDNVEKMDDDLEARWYELAIKALAEADFNQYEISSFAKAGGQSQHNLAYWHYHDFIGIGPGASGKEGLIRYTNQKRLDLYANGLRERDEEELSVDDEIFEALMMGLRLNQGIDITRFNQRFNIDLNEYFKSGLAKHTALNNLIIEENYLKTSDQGRNILNEILIDFL